MREPIVDRDPGDETPEQWVVWDFGEGPQWSAIIRGDGETQSLQFIHRVTETTVTDPSTGRILRAWRDTDDIGPAHDPNGRTNPGSGSC